MLVLGTSWDGADPLLRVAGDQLETLRPHGHIDWEIGERRHCTGYWAERWQPCPDGASPVTMHRQCLACFQGRGDPEREMDRPECIFEPACKADPSSCTCSFGGKSRPVPHVVYVAFHGILPKVGMTGTGRLTRDGTLTRLIEQGADVAFIAAECPDRATARLAERRIAMMHGLPEYRTYKETLPQIARPPKKELVEKRARDWMRRLDVDSDLIHIPHPTLEPLSARPHRVEAVGRHKGRFLGAKGPFYFYEARGGGLNVGLPRVHALHRGDLIGRELSIASADAR